MRPVDDSDFRPMTLGDHPELIVRLRLEEKRPQIIAAAKNRAEFDRLLAWIQGQPELRELLAHALALAYDDQTIEEWIAEFAAEADSDPG